MSFDVSWAAFNLIRKQEVLAAAGLQDTGQRDEAHEAPFSCAEMSNGWTVLFVNDSTYTYKNTAVLSANHAVLSVVVQEYVPLSMASFHVRGEEVWSILHDGKADAFDLTFTGTVPPQTQAIRDRILAMQRSEGKASRTDHLYDIPIELAETICGFRHDRWRFPWGQPLFTIATPKRG
jgi:hypothetical protein